MSLVLFSFASSCVIAGTIWFNKKMRVHPNQLIALLAVANIGSCICAGIYTVGTPKVACYLQIAQLFEYSSRPITWLINSEEF